MGKEDKSVIPQLHEYVDYKDQKYILAGFNGDYFPIPQVYGIQLVDHRRNDCNRGYVASYYISENRLYIYSFVLEAKNYPSIQGIDASPHTGLKNDWMVYTLNLASEFTGGIIFGRYSWFVDDRFGRETPQSFEEIFELVFENGILQREIDHSPTIHELRMKIAQQMGLSLQELKMKFRSSNPTDPKGYEYDKWLKNETNKRQIHYELENHLDDVWEHNYKSLS